MDSTDEQYREAIRRTEDKLRHFLHTFEKLQEEIHLGRVGESQARLREAGGDLFPTLPAELATLSPSGSLKEFHAKLSEAVASCAEAYATFLSGKGQQF